MPRKGPVAKRDVLPDPTVYWLTVNAGLLLTLSIIHLISSKNLQVTIHWKFLNKQ